MSPPAAGPAVGLRFPLGPWDLVTHQTRSGTHHTWIWETRVIEIAILSLITRCRGHLSSGYLVGVTKEALEYSSSHQGPAAGRHVRSLCSRTRPSLHSDEHPAWVEGRCGNSYTEGLRLISSAASEAVETFPEVTMPSGLCGHSLPCGAAFPEPGHAPGAVGAPPPTQPAV